MPVGILNLLIVRTPNFDRLSPGLARGPLGGNIASIVGSRLEERERILPGKGDNRKIK